MNVTAAIYGQLSGNAGVAAIVGTNVFTDVGTTGVWPQVAFEVAQEVDDAIDARELQRFHVSVSCEALKHADARTLRDAVKAAMDRQTWTTGTTTVVSCQYVDGDENAQAQDGGNVNRVYYAMDLQFSILAKGT